MSNSKLWFIFLTKDYDTSIAFYRDGLGLPIVHSWNNGPHERGTYFRAANGIIEIMTAPQEGEDVFPLFSSGSPQGITLGIEVTKVDEWYQRVSKKGLFIRHELTDFPWHERGFAVTD